jgi:hypothetical protein
LGNGPELLLDDGVGDGLGDDDCVGFGVGFAVFDGDGDGLPLAGFDAVDGAGAEMCAGVGFGATGVTTAFAWLASWVMSERVAASTACAPGGRLLSSSARSICSSCAIASARAGSPPLVAMRATICW